MGKFKLIPFKNKDSIYCFDLLRNSHPTVLMYAYGCEFLAFRTFLIVCQRVKKIFDTLQRFFVKKALRLSIKSATVKTGKQF